MLYDIREVNEMLVNETWMALVDPILVILTIFLIYLGYRKGFLSKLLSVFSFIVVVLISWNISPWLADAFQVMPQEWAPYQGSILQEFFYGYMNQLCIFVILVAVVSLALFVLKPILLLIGKLPVISWVNSLFGSLLGLVEAFLVMCVLLFILQTPLIANGNEVIEKTLLSHAAELQEKVFVVGSDLLEEFQVLSDDESVSTEQLEQFLKEKGIDENTIQQFLLELSQ